MAFILVEEARVGRLREVFGTILPYLLIIIRFKAALIFQKSIVDIMSYFGY